VCSRQDYESAIGTVDWAIALNSNSALALGFSAMAQAMDGRYDQSTEHGQRAVRLSPLDPMNYHPYLGMDFAYLFSGKSEEAVAATNLAVQSNLSFMVSRALLVASYVQVGRLDAAKTAAQRLLEAASSITVTMMEQMEFTAPEREVARFV
jgi:tetratricopeptide (TPR) repeat protein